MATAKGQKNTLVILVLALLAPAGCGKSTMTIEVDASKSDTNPIAQPDTVGAASDLADAVGGTEPAAKADAPPRGDLLPSDPPANHDLPPTIDLPGDSPAHEASIDVRQPLDLAGDPPRLGWDIGFSSEAAGLAELCTQTGGSVQVVSCWQRTDSYAEFFDSCAVPFVACSCTHTCTPVVACNCPNQGCFLPAYGCVGAASACTVGMDQTCNDNLMISSVHGKCVESGHCQCNGFDINPATGKCL